MMRYRNNKSVDGTVSNGERIAQAAVAASGAANATGNPKGWSASNTPGTAAHGTGKYPAVGGATGSGTGFTGALTRSGAAKVKAVCVLMSHSIFVPLFLPYLTHSVSSSHHVPKYPPPYLEIHPSFLHPPLQTPSHSPLPPPSTPNSSTYAHTVHDYTPFHLISPITPPHTTSSLPLPPAQSLLYGARSRVGWI